LKTRRAEEPCQDPQWQDVLFTTSWEHLRPVPTRGTPSHKKSPPHTTSLHLTRQVTPSHEESPPRMTSIHLARQASTSHDKPPPHASCSRLGLRYGSRHAVRPRDTNVFTATRGGPIPRAMQVYQLAARASSWP
jgi:hypothetical protein